MNIIIKKSKDDNELKTIWLPMEETELEEVCKELGIEMTTEPNCHIESSRDERLSNIIADKNVNIDELNYSYFALQKVPMNLKNSIILDK